MYVQVIPSEVADIMSEPLENIAERCRLKNDAIGFESLHDAVIVAENISASLLLYVEPENLLFIFGETIQSTDYAPIELPFSPPSLSESEYISKHGNSEKSNSNYESQPKNRPVILCKLKHPNELEKLLADKKQKGRYDTERYEVTWCEFQELKNSLGDFSSLHIETPNQF